MTRIINIIRIRIQDPNQKGQIDNSDTQHSFILNTEKSYLPIDKL